MSALSIFNPKKAPSMDSSDYEHYDKDSLGILIEQLEQLYIDGEAFKDESNMLNNLPMYYSILMCGQIKETAWVYMVVKPQCTWV